MRADIQNFRLPRYDEIPDVGLFLEQTVKYINQYLAPLGCMEITTSMVSNYVKKGYIQSPVKKQYYPDQIAYLFFIAIAKHSLSMEDIDTLFHLQKQQYTSQIAYDYFCDEFENMLFYIFGLKESIDKIGVLETTLTKKMLRSVIISSAHIIHLNDCFAAQKETE